MNNIFGQRICDHRCPAYSHDDNYGDLCNANLRFFGRVAPIDGKIQFGQLCKLAENFTVIKENTMNTPTNADTRINILIAFGREIGFDPETLEVITKDIANKMDESHSISDITKVVDVCNAYDTKEIYRGASTYTTMLHLAKCELPDEIKMLIAFGQSINLEREDMKNIFEDVNSTLKTEYAETGILAALEKVCVGHNTTDIYIGATMFGFLTSIHGITVTVED